MKKIETSQAAAAIGPYSQGIVANGFVFTSGQIPVDPATGEVKGNTAEEQAEVVMRNLDAVLRAGGAALDTVIKTTCFLNDIANFAAFNSVYAKYFGTVAPARSCMAVRDLPKGVMVEVEAVALVVKEEQ